MYSRQNQYGFYETTIIRFVTIDGLVREIHQTCEHNYTNVPAVLTFHLEHQEHYNRVQETASFRIFLAVHLDSNYRAHRSDHSVFLFGYIEITLDGPVIDMEEEEDECVITGVFTPDPVSVPYMQSFSWTAK